MGSIDVNAMKMLTINVDKVTVLLNNEDITKNEDKCQISEKTIAIRQGKWKSTDKIVIKAAWTTNESKAFIYAGWIH